jgi:vanillate O-demethylase monooxygenase subunit
MRCNWELNNDNLLDLSHVVYVHAETLGGANLDHFPIRTERSERKVSMKRFCFNVPPTPLFARYLNLEENTMDRWSESEIVAPSHCVVDASFAPPGMFAPGQERRDAPVGFRALITATPETETTSFMFYAQCRNFAKDDAELTRVFVKDFRGVFFQDIAVMEAQQRVYSARPDAPRIDVNGDASQLAMRALIQRLAAQERQKTGRAAAE